MAKLKISIFTSYTNPEKRMDPWVESLQCYREFADEVVVVGEDWEYEFSFDHIGKTFQQGFEEASGDWVIKMDIDTVFHENDFDKLRSYLHKYKDTPGLCLTKRQIFTPDRFHTKARMCFVLNKKKYPNLILNGGGDLCDPTLNGQLLNENNMATISIPFWNYDSTFKTRDIIAEDRGRFARAWKRQFGNYGNRGGGSSEEAFEAWYKMIQERYKKHIFKLKPTDHPKYFQNKIQNLNHNQFGYDAFGLKENIQRTTEDYYEAIKDKYYSEFKVKIKSFRNS